MHPVESRGRPGAEVEEGACSAPAALDPSAPRSWRPQGQDVELQAFNV